MKMKRRLGGSKVFRSVWENANTPISDAMVVHSSFIVMVMDFWSAEEIMEWFW